MADKYIINFPVEIINPEDAVADQDTIQAILEFDIPGLGDDVTVDAADISCLISKYGKLSMSYDLEDAFMVPGMFSLEIGDPLAELDTIFFSPAATADAIPDKQAKLTIKINGTTKFIGNCLENSIESDTGNKVISFSAAPKTDLINKRMVYDTSTEDNIYNIAAATHSSGVVTLEFTTVHSFAVGKRISITDVVGMTDLNTNFRVLSIPTEYQVTVTLTTAQSYTSGGAATQIENLNPFEYEQSVGPTTVYHPITSILEDIYRLVNPSIDYPTSLEISNDWEFRGERIADPCYLNDIIFTELYQVTDRLYFDNSYGIKNCGDVLRSLALDWCSFTGLISYERAFFKKLFQYDPGNLQTVSVYNWRKGYRYGLIDYVTVTTANDAQEEPYHEGTFTEFEERTIERNSLTAYYSTGLFGGTVYALVSRSNHYVFDIGTDVSNYEEGDIYSNNGSQFTITGTPYAASPDKTRITTIRTSGSNAPEASGTLTRVSGSGEASYTYNSVGDADGFYRIYNARDPILFDNAFKDHGALLAKFWYTYRGDINNCRVDKFTFKGIDYDFLKDFNYSGLKFQPISMTFDYANYLTECEAIYLGAL